jgi:ribosome-binding factor A
MGKINEVKKKQRESVLYKEVQPLLKDVFIDSQSLRSYSFSRVEISKCGGMCRFFLINHLQDITSFEAEALNELKLYGPSLRRAVSKILGKKYSPEVKFVYDKGLAISQEIDLAFERAEKKEKGEA